MSTSAIAAALGAYTLFIIVLLILLVVAYWKMFTKAGIAAFFLPNIMTLYYGFASSCTYAGPQD